MSDRGRPDPDFPRGIVAIGRSTGGESADSTRRSTRGNRRARGTSRRSFDGHSWPMSVTRRSPSGKDGRSSVPPPRALVGYDQWHPEMITSATRPGWITSAGRMPSSPSRGSSVWRRPMPWPVNPLGGKTINRRAVCGRSACTVRREGRPNAGPSLPLSRRPRTTSCPGNPRTCNISHQQKVLCVGSQQTAQKNLINVRFIIKILTFLFIVYQHI
jgi:hypothetical protein